MENLDVMRNKLLEIKGDNSYEEWEKDIIFKTGKRISYSSLNKYVKGDRMPPIKALEIIAEYAGIEVKELFAKGTQVEVINTEIHNIPIIGFVPAGGPLVVEENLEGHLPLPAILLKGNNDFCLKVRGNSMKDVNILDGDMVLVHPQPVAENGQTVIARINGEVTCKRFYKMNGKCRLEPANSEYQPIDCTEIEIIGIILKVIKDVF